MSVLCWKGMGGNWYSSSTINQNLYVCRLLGPRGSSMPQMQASRKKCALQKYSNRCTVKGKSHLGEFVCSRIFGSPDSLLETPVPNEARFIANLIYKIFHPFGNTDPFPEYFYGRDTVIDNLFLFGIFEIFQKCLGF